VPKVLSVRGYCGWVIERALGWLSKCRAILVRYDKKAANYLGLIKVACILLWYRRQ
jgi:transposase